MATLELLWLTYLLQELKVSLDQVPTLHRDCKSAKALASNLKHHLHSTRIELGLHFVRELIALKQLLVDHVSSSDQLADILTKPLSFDHFTYLPSKDNVLPKP